MQSNNSVLTKITFPVSFNEDYCQYKNTSKERFLRKRVTSRWNIGKFSCLSILWSSFLLLHILIHFSLIYPFIRVNVFWRIRIDHPQKNKHSFESDANSQNSQLPLWEILIKSKTKRAYHVPSNIRLNRNVICFR